MPVYPKSKGKWRVRIYIGGKPKDEIFEGTKKEARNYEAAKRLEVAASDPEMLRRVVPTFSVFCLNEYKEFCAKHIKPSWWRKLKYVLVDLIEHFGTYRLDRIPQTTVATYTDARKKDIAATSVNNELRVLSRVLNVARDEFHYPASKLKLTKLRVSGKGKAIAWNDEEMARLFNATAELDVELLPILTFIANTGCRSGEALALEWSQVDLESGHIRFWPSDYWQPKNNQAREVPIGEALLPWLQAPHHHPRWVFPSRRGGRYAYWLKMRWEAVRKRAGLSGGVHQLRHTYASHFLRTKPDLVLLAEVLGHSDVAVTKLYQHMLPDHLARARNVVNFVAPVGPAAVEAHRRQRSERKATKKVQRKTVPRTVPTTVENAVSIERDNGFEPSTFSLGMQDRPWPRTHLESNSTT
ncbi:MAG: site-specific integrase [Proteobacteria bacterium]|nr:site-specific integrase [Pseudomonadota bacterium]